MNQSGWNMYKKDIQAIMFHEFCVKSVALMF